jgi:hypothetical protein
MDAAANKTQASIADQTDIDGQPGSSADDQPKHVAEAKTKTPAGHWEAEAVHRSMARAAAGPGTTAAQPPKSYVSLPPDCRGCNGNVHDDEQINRILAALSRHPEACVDDDEYAERLSACGSCPSLANGTTCRLCGCYVAVRAKLRSNHCPMPGGAKW